MSSLQEQRSYFDPIREDLMDAGMKPDTFESLEQEFQDLEEDEGENAKHDSHARFLWGLLSTDEYFQLLKKNKARARKWRKAAVCAVIIAILLAIAIGVASKLISELGGTTYVSDAYDPESEEIVVHPATGSKVE